MIELYGYLDIATRDWVDGLFSNIFRELNRPIEHDVRKAFFFIFALKKLNWKTVVNLTIVVEFVTNRFSSILALD